MSGGGFFVQYIAFVGVDLVSTRSSEGRYTREALSLPYGSSTVTSPPFSFTCPFGNTCSNIIGTETL